MIGLNSVLPAVIGLFLVVLTGEGAPAGTSGRTGCDIQKTPCVKIANSGMEVELEVTPRPLKTMRELEFIVTLRSQGKPVSGASILLDLSMPGMFMGNNQPKLAEDQRGRYRGRGVIPRCATGLKTWEALIAVSRGGKVEKVAYRFEVD